jgi:membrane protein
MKKRIASIVAWVQRQRPVRVFLNYSEKRGPILASGLAYQGLFAGFAAIWVGFSIAGIVLSGNFGLRERLIDVLAEAVPGLIQNGDTEGAIDPELLLTAGSFTFAAVIALGGLLFTALGWLDSARASVRTIFGLASSKRNFALLKVIDLAFGLGFGVALLVFVGLSIASTQASGWLLDLAGLRDSDVAFVVGRVITALLMFGLGSLIVGALYRFLSGIPIPWSRLRNGVLIAAAGLTALQLGGTVVIAGASRNPLIAPFAVVAGLLIILNLGCQVILLGASWIAVDVADRGILLDPEAKARALAEAQEEAIKEDRERNPRGLRRLFHRRRRA